jgi:hypothetical protein
MLTRTIVVVLAGTGLFAVAASAQEPAAPTQGQPATINQRIENQRDRIQAGVADEQLTKGEATRLKVDDAKIQAQARVERNANGGTLTTGEKKQLNRELNRNSRRIYRDRHNNVRQKSSADRPWTFHTWMSRRLPSLSIDA